MNCAVVTTIQDDQIDGYRQRYDPKVNFIPPHVTFVFPFPVTDERLVIDHISSILNNFDRFPISFNNIEKSSDNYIFLIADRGQDNCVKIHDALYTGILSQHLRKDLPYHPHLTIAQSFPESNVDQMVEEAKFLLKDKIYTITSIKLIKIEDLNKPRSVVKEFQLNK